MLAAEALRLAAIEVLCPTSAIAADSGYPTLAGINVLDSRAASLSNLDENKSFTPILSLYTSESRVELMGDASAAVDTEATCMLDIVAELAVTSHDDDGEFADAMADDDPEARLVLAALCSQVRFLLDQSQAGGIWRRLVRRIVRIEEQAFASPELGIRYQRTLMRFACSIRDDDFDVEDGGLPEPVRSVHAALPENSYAKAKLSELAAHFLPDPAPGLTGATIETDMPVQSDVNFQE